jgi:hypothetical protein
MGGSLSISRSDSSAHIIDNARRSHLRQVHCPDTCLGRAHSAGRGQHIASVLAMSELLLSAAVDDKAESKHKQTKYQE